VGGIVIKAWMMKPQAGGLPLTGWSYRKSVTLSRASGAVSNYQMKLLLGESSGATGEDVDCGGLCATDFDDIRFTKSDGTTVLDYWIESISGSTPNQLATIWIEFDFIDTGATTFYMYYGNAGAAAYSNITNTFIVGDDFEWGSDGDHIHTSGGGVTWTTGNDPIISTTQKYSGSRSAKIPNHVSYGTMYCSVTPSSSISIQYRIYKTNSATYGDCGHGNGTKRMQLYYSADESLLYDDGVGGKDTTKKLTADAFNLIECNNFDFTAGTYDIYLNSTVAKTGAAMAVQVWSNGVVYFTGANGGAGQDYWIDNLIVRNWLATEPAWGSWGAQES
jgi:hypothetical protein